MKTIKRFLNEAWHCYCEGTVFEYWKYYQQK